MTSESPRYPSGAPTGEHVARRTMTQRRRRVVRSLLTVVGVTLIILVLSVLNRDEQAVQGCHERMARALTMLQQHHAEWLRDPQKFPLPTIETQLGAEWRDHVLDNWRFTEEAAFAREVGVCCCEQPHSRLVQPPGRYVIIYHVTEQKYELVWMNESDYQRRAEELGFRIRSRP